MVAGMITGFVEATLVVTPVETMKTKLIHDGNSANPRFRGLFHGMSVIVAEQGLRGIYKGWVPTMAKQTGNQGVRFMVFEEVKKWLGVRPGEPVPFCMCKLCVLCVLQNTWHSLSLCLMDCYCLLYFREELCRWWCCRICLSACYTTI